MFYYGDVYDKCWYRNTQDENQYALNPHYQEIIKLHDMLVEHDITHVIRRVFDGWQVCYPTDSERILSAIEHRGSYGRDSDKIEIMGLLTPEESVCDDVLGYLSAKEVFTRIVDHWTKINRYEEYKREWCESRGYRLEDVNEEIGVNGECYVGFDEWCKNEGATTRNPVEIAYKLLVAHRDSDTIPDMGIIEEVIGYLVEALA